MRPPDSGRLLVTSRNAAIGRLASVIEVAEFSRTESIILLRRRCPTLSNDDADRIAAAVGDLPLAVEQVACLIAETGLDVDDYLSLLDTEPTAAGLADPTLDRHPGLVAVVAAGRTRVSSSSLAATAFLDQMAFLAPEPLPLSPRRPDHVPQGPGVQVGDAAATAAIVRLLTGLGLVRRSGTTLQMHRLVQSLLRHQLSASHQTATRQAAQELLATASPGDPANPATWSAYATLTPHVQAVTAPTDTGAIADPEPGRFRDLLLNLTRYLYLSGQYAAAHGLSSLAYHRWTQTLGPDNPDTLHAANRLAAALDRLGEFTSARDLGLDTLNRRRRVLGNDHPDTLTSANNLAVSLNGLGERAATHDLLQDTLERQRRTLGSDHPDTLRTAENLAVALEKLENYTAALELQQDTFARRTRVLGNDHPDTLHSAGNVAAALELLGEHAQARDLQQDILRRQRRTLGDDHPDTLRTAGNLGLTLRSLGDFATARDVLDDTLDRQQRVLGHSHPDTQETEQLLTEIQRALDGSETKQTRR